MQDQFEILPDLTFTSALIQVCNCAKEMKGTGIESSDHFVWEYNYVFENV